MVRHHIAIDDAKAVCDRGLDCNLQYLLGRLATKLRDGVRAQRLYELGSVFLANPKRLWSKRWYRRESAAALTYRPRKQTFGQR